MCQVFGGKFQANRCGEWTISMETSVMMAHAQPHLTSAHHQIYLGSKGRRKNSVLEYVPMHGMRQKLRLPQIVETVKSAKRHALDIGAGMSMVSGRKRSLDEGASPSSHSKLCESLAVISSDPHDEDTHKYMDSEVFKQYHHTGEDKEAVLLSIIVKECWSMAQTYAKVEAAKSVVDGNLQLRHELNTAVELKSFKYIRNLDMFQNHNLVYDEADVQSVILAVKRRFATALKSFVHGGVENAITLAERERPDPLLREFRKYSGDFNLNKNLAKMIQEIFSWRFGKTVVYNAFGTGKTRTAFEVLVQRWGFYFTAAQKNHLFHGSSDLPVFMGALKDVAGFTETVEIPHDNGDVDQMLDRRNSQLAGQCFRRIWLARRLVFGWFLEISGGLKMGTSTKKTLWLILQANPLACLGSDIFYQLTNALQVAGHKVLDRTAKLDRKALVDEDDLRSDNWFFVVIDDAYNMVERYPKSFLNDYRTGHQSPLKELISHWFEDDPHFVFCGPIPNRSLTTPRMEFGAVPATPPRTFALVFDCREAQEEYLVRQMMWDAKVNDPVVRHLLDRVWRWLRGRQVSMSPSFLRLLRAVGCAPPHELLDLYIIRITGFTPNDGRSSAEDEEMLSTEFEVELGKIGLPLMFEKLSEHKHKCVERHLFQVLLANLFRTNSKQIVRYRDILIKFGFSYISHEMWDLPFDEPLVHLAVAQYFHHRDLRTALKQEMCPAPSPGSSRNAADKRIAMEEILAWNFLRRLDGTNTLKEIFQWIGECPAWAKGSAQLVARMRRSPDAHFQAVPASFHFAPSPSFGMSTETLEETFAWMKGKYDGIPFCFPRDGCGPEIVFLIEVGDELVWVSVHSKYFHKSISQNAEDGVGKYSDDENSEEEDDGDRSDPHDYEEEGSEEGPFTEDESGDVQRDEEYLYQEATDTADIDMEDFEEKLGQCSLDDCAMDEFDGSTEDSTGVLETIQNSFRCDHFDSEKLQNGDIRFLRVVSTWPVRLTDTDLGKLAVESNHPLAWFELPVEGDLEAECKDDYLCKHLNRGCQKYSSNECYEGKTSNPDVYAQSSVAIVSERVCNFPTTKFATSLERHVRLDLPAFCPSYAIAIFHFVSFLLCKHPGEWASESKTELVVKDSLTDGSEKISAHVPTLRMMQDSLIPDVRRYGIGHNPSKGFK
ncbi:hypothetical protein BD410DRAFT_800322 [Rickenella mellea]|uniref:Uncharacterized protein n=1 Tax=Rickenella mellea TaxID=50990 RepID=A0A4Y7QHA3_9AGAM|nr:hypothetical protein BD410DRAFT_800322 [Rickenella mellea]